MNSKPMLFECLECGETYLADNLCDGYKCPKCDGYVVGRGFIKEIERLIKEDQRKINRAKENGLIRKYTKSQEINDCIHGVDYASERDKTTMTLYIGADTSELKEKLNELEEQLDRINDKLEELNYGELYTIGTSTLGMSVDEISNTAIKEMAEIVKDAMRMLIYKE